LLAYIFTFINTLSFLGVLLLSSVVALLLSASTTARWDLKALAEVVPHSAAGAIAAGYPSCAALLDGYRDRMTRPVTPLLRILFYFLFSLTNCAFALISSPPPPLLLSLTPSLSLSRSL
jgi:hypothetical protein